MTIAATLANCVITPAGRAIAAKVARLVASGLPIEDALAIAAELGIERGLQEGVDIVAARLGINLRLSNLSNDGLRLSNQAKYGDLPR